VRHGRFDREHVRQVTDEEVASLPPQERLDDARRIFEQVALADDFVDFLTLPAYQLLD
jgi:malate synthase